MYNTGIYDKITCTVQELIDCSRYNMTKNYLQHGTVTVFMHCISVSVMSLKIAQFFGIRVDEKSLIRGALLHDYFLYDWHESDNNSHRLHGFTHPSTALRNAKQDFVLSDKECDIIIHHMFPLVPFPPKCREAWIVCLADKICALYETLFCRFPKLINEESV